MNSLRHLIFLALWALLLPKVFATGESALSVDFSAEAEEVTVGDVFDARLTVTHPPGGQLKIGHVSKNPELMLAGSTQMDRSASEDRKETEIVLHLVSFRTGIHTNSVGILMCELEDGSVLQQPLDPFVIQVRSVLSETNQVPHDIEGTVDWSRPVPGWLWALILIPLIAVAAGLISARCLRKGTDGEGSPLPAIPPHEKAWKALQLLREKGYIVREEYEPFFNELSLILRQYIEDRFSIHAPEQTTEEFIQATADTRALPVEHRPALRTFLEQSDLVKFARHHPSRTDMEQSLEVTEQFIRETEPREEPEV